MSAPRSPGGIVGGRLLERDAATARTAAALSSAQGGEGSVVFVEGPAGIGKSTILSGTRSSAEAAGMRVLAARGGVLEREFPFGIVRQLFEPALAAATEAERAALLQGPAAVAGRLLELPGPAGDGAAPAAPADPSSAVLHGLYWLTANLAGRSPVGILVDDAHWADAASLRFLQFMLPRIRELPVALVVAARADELDGPAEQLRALAGAPVTDHLRPAPLSAAAVAALLRDQLETQADPAFARRCHEITGGNPFLLTALMAALRERAVAPTSDALAGLEALGADGVGRWLAVRIGRLPGSATPLSQAVAVLDIADLSDAAALAGLPPADAAHGAGALRAAGILAPEDPLRFVHAMLRAGVYARIPAGRRSQEHRRAARHLAQTHAPQERVAGHLLASDPEGDAWVVEELASAARVATRRGALDSAAAYLRRALEEPADPEHRSRLLVELGAAEARLGDARARADLEAAFIAAPDAPARVDASLVLAHALLDAERYEEAVGVLDRAATTLHGDDPLAGLLEVLTVGVAVHHASTATTHGHRIAAVRRRADEDPHPAKELLAVAAFIAVLGNEPCKRPAELARRALAAHGDRVTEPTDLPWFNQAAITLVWTESFDEVVPILDRAVVRARARGDAALLSSSLAYRAYSALRRGDLDAAEADTRTALGARDLPAPSMFRTLNESVLAATRLERGHVDEPALLVDSLGDKAVQPAGPNAFLRLVRGNVRAAQGRTEEALADFMAVGEVAEATGIRSPGVLSWRSAAALAHLQSGRAEHAAALAREELVLARVFGGPRTLGVALRTAGVVFGGAAGESLLREAAAVLATTQAPVEHAHALLELGAVLRRARRRRDARAHLAQAAELAARCGAARLATRAQEELAASGAVIRRDAIESRSELTASELRVARHAADGLTNREIAQALFLTEKTIETHLSSAYRKLDIRSRAELPDALGAPQA